MRNQMLRWDGEDLYWSELRPDEAGRIVVCRRDPGGAISDVTPPGFNARTRVHEYGGGHFAVSGGTVWFTNYKDQRLYRQDRGGKPRPITPAEDVRHADMVVDDRRGRLYAVREDGVVFVARVEGRFELLAENKMGERVLASPVPVSNRLFIRGEQHLFCVEQ